MILEVNDTKTIEDIRKEFSEYYPFLSIEFYDEPHKSGETSSYKHLLPHNKTIRDIRRKHNPGMLEIHSWHKTGIVEQEFKRLYGLNVQILRRQGDAWIQTAGTDELSLEEQNEIGRNATQDVLHGTDRSFEKEKPL
ncbi:MAG TPA: hypothetical protein VG676_10010 [Chitinophagaceae bacterium]|jgi:hypothetical protein|nr:hypothetical protein [Chitinophagaceae bacterium]